MPNYGSLVLSDFAARYFTPASDPCRRRGPLKVARLLRKQDDPKFADHLPTLANCENARAFSLYDRCKARYGLCP
jgi:hypothetical protein